MSTVRTLTAFVPLSTLPAVTNAGDPNFETDMPAFHTAEKNLAVEANSNFGALSTNINLVIDDINIVAGEVNTNALAAVSAKDLAVPAKDLAIAAKDATIILKADVTLMRDEIVAEAIAWVSGNSYKQYSKVNSPITSLAYRVKTTAFVSPATSTVDPSLDSANWVLADATSAGHVVKNAITTFTQRANLQITGDNVTITDNGTDTTIINIKVKTDTPILTVVSTAAEQAVYSFPISNYSATATYTVVLTPTGDADTSASFEIVGSNLIVRMPIITIAGGLNVSVSSEEPALTPSITVTYSIALTALANNNGTTFLIEGATLSVAYLPTLVGCVITNSLLVYDGVATGATATTSALTQANMTRYKPTIEIENANIFVSATISDITLSIDPTGLNIIIHDGTSYIDLLVGAVTITGTEDINTKLLLHFDNNLLDDSSSSHTVTAIGNAITTNILSKFGNYSVYFDGNGDYLSIPASADFNFIADFTIDGWLYNSATSGDGNTIFCFGGSNTFEAYISSLGDLIFNFNATSMTIAAVDIPVAGNWFHIAFVRNGTNLTIYINGVAKATVVFTAVIDVSTLELKLGRLRALTTYDWNGYIDEFRIVNGVAKWTANFIPPTTAYSFNAYKFNTTIDYSAITDARVKPSIPILKSRFGLLAWTTEPAPILEPSTASTLFYRFAEVATSNASEADLEQKIEFVDGEPLTIKSIQNAITIV